MENEKLQNHVVYIADENYVLPTKASIRSLVRRCGDERICIHVIAVDMSAKSRAEIAALARGEIAVEVLPFANEYANLGVGHFYVSRAALFKFQLPNIFKSLDRVLYIDGDTIAGVDFAEIFAVDISQHYAAVCPDMLAMKIGRWHEKIGHEKYFNSGVMFLNLKKMREDAIAERLIEYKKRDTCKDFMDQNALNAVIGGNALWISPKFNFMMTYKRINEIYGCEMPLHEMAEFFGIDDGEMRRCFENPAIAHYTDVKSWDIINHRTVFVWMKYLPMHDATKCFYLYVKNRLFLHGMRKIRKMLHIGGNFGAKS